MTSLIGQFVLIVLLADFLTGFFHWLEDTYCTTGKLFSVCDENIEHHRDPSLMARVGNVVSRNRATGVLFIIGTVIGLIFGLSWHWYLVVFFAVCGNEVHYINHMKVKNMNGLQRFLSDSGLIQSRQQHARHHKPPYSRHYCVLTSFLNEVLELIRFWRILEAAIAWVSFGRIIPQRTLESRGGF